MKSTAGADPAAITPELIAAHGLTEAEYETVLACLGREPSLTELGIFSVMWSEHCSYKSSRVWLKKFPTAGPQVVQGPGENAGAVDIGEGLVAVFKMESHNHPSFIEPYQGAATGVGGIMRDVFTMGARPVAMLNSLRFGEPLHERTRHLVSGAVAGIGGYGNCVGIPTVGGEVGFDASYNGNILVNAMCVGIAHADQLFFSAASGIGNPVVYVGSKTGRDGIHGATMASAEFDEASEEKRPTVQVGDPFTEKLLLEACLELMAGDAIVAIQDMGAAGLTSSSVEMADKGGVGIEIDLDRVPQRETHMSAYEMMLSESQERMLMVLKPGREDDARAIFERWGIDFAVIGRITDTGRIVVSHQGGIEADIPLGPLGDNAPLYERPFVRPTPAAALDIALGAETGDLGNTLIKMMGSAPLSSRRWIWEQYDHTIMGDTVARPGGDAAVVRVHGTRRALALACDVTPRYDAADPATGGAQAVCECWRNLTAVGATPLAITDCLNFGNPERPEIMGEFAAAVEGMSAACAALDFPVVSGNVSLYNETAGQAIKPTPTVGGVGLIEDLDQTVTLALKQEGDTLVLVGREAGHLGRSIWLETIHG
ncbi:MAG: phosphoribosylformylglycinamidine synthase subunit PurL, partial [Rhizobiales bacterium]|nr:phosphoribosylformylglycinamidine synthase subunit PurL [Hyphomicrobiales bacterium]